MTSPRVLTFGSALLVDAEGWRAAARTAASELTEGGAVVLSSPPAWRAALRTALHAAGQGDLAAAEAGALEVVALPVGFARSLGLASAVEQAAAPKLQRLRELVQGAGLVGHASERTRDAANSLLGSLSAILFAALLGTHGISTCVASPLPPAGGPHGRGRPLEGSQWECSHTASQVQVLSGGFGMSAAGAVLAFGPGGTDLSAVFLAARWRSAEVVIWTGDDGIQSADPSLVPGAAALRHLSYAEARALSGFGSRALRPDVLATAAGAGIDLVLANLHNPARRTRISATAPPRAPGSVASVVYKEGLHLVRMKAEDSLAALAALDEALREAGIQRFGAIAGPEGSLLVLRAGTEASRLRLVALAEQGAEVSAGWALVALVGEGLRATPGSALRLLAPCQMEPVEGLLAGSSPISVSFLVPEDRLANLIPRLHKLWIEEGGTRRAS